LCKLNFNFLEKFYYNLNFFKRPIPALIGLCCQYIMMPLLAYTFVSIFSLSPPEALALFIYGCCPGGSASNTWTILFEGDINLSAIMTFISTVTAFIAMPAWIFTLGSTFTARANLQIPYLMLLANIFITVGPCIFGFLLSHFIPKVKQISHHRFVKRAIILIMITFFTFVLIVKSYTFRLMSWQNLLAGPLIPWAGYFVGGLVAYICRLPWTQIKTISIETGLQNVGVAFLIVITNFPSPSKEMAYLPLISVGK
jgi:solute carrier family 10 (sodium/bile acid cotransporter), member 3/5